MVDTSSFFNPSTFTFMNLSQGFRKYLNFVCSNLKFYLNFSYVKLSHILKSKVLKR